MSGHKQYLISKQFCNNSVYFISNIDTTFSILKCSDWIEVSFLSADSSHRFNKLEPKLRKLEILHFLYHLTCQKRLCPCTLPQTSPPHPWWWPSLSQGWCSGVSRCNYLHQSCWPNLSENTLLHSWTKCLSKRKLYSLLF